MTIEFGSTYISREDHKLHINAHVSDLNAYKYVRITRIAIDDENTYTPSGPSSKPVFSWDFADHDSYDPTDTNSAPWTDALGDILLDRTGRILTMTLSGSDFNGSI